MSETDDDPDLLAGEYVLGCLDPEAAAAVVARAAREPALAAAIRAWERRLAPLAELLPEAAPPPELWQRIAAALPPPPGELALARFRRRLRLWQAGAAAALAVAAALAGILLWREPPSPVVTTTPRAIATLAPTNTGNGSPFVAVMDTSGEIAVASAAPPSVAPDRSLELWELPAGETRPRSLGVLPSRGAYRVRAPAAAPKTQLMISLEPRGGSPTGQPTGPVVYAGTLVAIE
jgi:anti-sigma-K factor RskA